MRTRLTTDLETIDPDQINHRADACGYDTSSNERQLIDFTFTNAAKSSGINGTKPGKHADEADALKEKQYSREFPGFGPGSSGNSEHGASWQLEPGYHCLLGRPG
jgi:hypothetical protein